MVEGNMWAGGSSECAKLACLCRHGGRESLCSRIISKLQEQVFFRNPVRFLYSLNYCGVRHIFCIVTV